MTTHTRTCDKCKSVIPPEHWNPYRVVKIHVSPYDIPGTTLDFCVECWMKLFPAEVKLPQGEVVGKEERAMKLLDELISLVRPE